MFQRIYSFASVCLLLELQGTGPGIISGLVKGFKGGKVNNTTDLSADSKSNCGQLESIFSKNPFPDRCATTKDDQETVIEVDIGLSIFVTIYFWKAPLPCMSD